MENLVRWNCPRCPAYSGQPCRTRAEAVRRFPHLVRLVHGLVFDLTERWAKDQPTPARLRLAELILSDQSQIHGQDRTQGTSDPKNPSWREIVALLQQAEQLEQTLTGYLIDRPWPFLSLNELSKLRKEQADQLKEAAKLLRWAWTHDRSHTEQMCLNEIVGKRRDHFTLEELRAAHDLAQVRSLTDDMHRRTKAVPNVAHEPGSHPRVWSVRWELTGLYTATADVDLIRGWAAHPEVVADDLCNWNTRPSSPEVRWEDGKPVPQDRLCAYTTDWPDLSDEQITQLFYARSERLAEVVTTVEALRNRWPVAEVPAQVAARAEELQQQEPQLPDITDKLKDDDETPWTISSTAEWVPTRSIVNTADEVWGEFDRDEIARCSRWVPDKAIELLAATELPRFLACHFGAPADDLVHLHRIPGPAGPLYILGSGGSHRVHLSRILRLPWLFAITTLTPLPRKLHVTEVADDWDECEDTVRLWQGLLKNGLVHGQLIDSYTLQLDYVPAPWFLLPAELATKYNQRYELLHPGALQAVGAPAAALENAYAWRSWLTGH